MDKELKTYQEWYRKHRKIFGKSVNPDGSRNIGYEQIRAAFDNAVALGKEQAKNEE